MSNDDDKMIEDIFEDGDDEPNLDGFVDKDDEDYVEEGEEKVVIEEKVFYLFSLTI
jgi:hypothetical protein